MTSLTKAQTKIIKAALFKALKAFETTFHDNEDSEKDGVADWNIIALTNALLTIGVTPAQRKRLLALRA